jgi:hypothetical protein
LPVRRATVGLQSARIRRLCEGSRSHERLPEPGEHHHVSVEAESASLGDMMRAALQAKRERGVNRVEFVRVRDS